ncbi:MAG TPA: phosphoribosylamine--glycine ligase [Solirubrobacteraceae bacterium]|nr:phosphoribosylamine--glycine ligase [Solirubrobacteraceae bacterium]
MRTLIVGHGGRESALASRMAEHSELYAFAGHLNPSLVRYAEESGGRVQLGDVCDAAAVAQFAREQEIEIAMISADEPLAAGVVDELLAQGTQAVGPTRAGAEIEWNKVFARELLADVAPEATPKLRIVDGIDEIEEAVASFDDLPIVVKPSGLTGGKGVKVMGPHLASHAEAADYARSLLADAKHEAVLIEEKITGAEFTIQAISDGKTTVFPYSTYDYPYRFDGDEGPGTGGMGSLSTEREVLPFMTNAHYEEACSIIERVIARLGNEGRRFNGVMNSGFFATAEGVRVIEFNARFGDPECMNIMSLFEGDWTRVMERICAGTLSTADVPLSPHASLVLYLVSPDYALPRAPGSEPQTYEFELDVEKIERAGCEAFFSSAVHVAGSTFRTVGTSRAVALTTTAPTLAQAHERIVAQASEVEVLEWRREVGDERYLQGLSALVAAA